MIAALFLLVLANIAYIIYNMVKGKDRLKQQIKEAKKKRLEEEIKEQEEEEEKKAKAKKEEEEFTSKQYLSN